MHTGRTALAIAVATLVVTSCSDRPTAPRDTAGRSVATPQLDRGGTQNRTALLTNIPVAGTVVGGGAFTGTLTITHFAIDRTTRVLTVNGVLNGTANAASGAVQVVNQVLTTTATLSSSSMTADAASAGSIFRPAAMASCPVLNLDLGPLNLDLLGLVVDLNEVVLDIAAVSGTGKLVGNLLCAVVGLLDIPGAIAGIVQLLDRINTILGALNTVGLAAPASAPVWIYDPGTPVISST